MQQAHLFVAVLGTSSYTYAEATRDEQLASWIGAHVRAFEFCQGVPKLVVPDNTKTGVTKACRYDPDLNPTYQERAMHYGVGAIPARPYKPRDKAKVDKGAPLDLVGDLKQNYTAGKTKIMAAADQMPEAGYAFQPVPEERSFGQWVAHVADLQAQFCGGITGNAKQLGAAAKTTKTDLTAALKESFDMCDAAYDGTTAANANEEVQTFRGPEAGSAFKPGPGRWRRQGQG